MNVLPVLLLVGSSLPRYSCVPFYGIVPERDPEWTLLTTERLRYLCIGAGAGHGLVAVSNGLAQNFEICRDLVEPSLHMLYSVKPTSTTTATRTGTSCFFVDAGLPACNSEVVSLVLYP